MKRQNLASTNLPIILGTISILITIIGLLIWATVTFSPTEQVITDPPLNEEAVTDELNPTTIIVEEQPAVTDLNFLLPLFLTSLGSLTSFAALGLEWRKNKRERTDETLTRRIQQLDLELKTLQLYKLRQELDGDPTAETTNPHHEK